MSTNPNDPNHNREREKVPWESPVTGLILPLLVGFLAFAGTFFVYQMEYDRWNWRPKTDLRHIPPEWITYRQTSLFACPVEGQPISFALQGESTFVIGVASPPSLSFYDESGTLLRKIALPEEPRAIICGTQETILTDKIVVAHSKTLAIYHAEGDCVALWQLPDEQSNIRSLVLTPNYLFAADTGKRCVHRFDESGKLDLTFSRDLVVYASPITMTFSPSAVPPAADGLLYIVNPGKHRIEVFTQEGIHQPELGWGEPSGSLSDFVGCCNPIYLAALADGRILTVEKAISRIKIFRTGGTAGMERTGALDCVVAGPSILEDVPAKLGRTPAEPGGRYFAAVPLPNGNIAVFDYEYAVVRIFSP